MEDAPVFNSTRRLVRFRGDPSDSRELGLAYAEIALRGDESARGNALRLLKEALPRYPDEPEVLTRLGYLYQSRGEVDRAVPLYERALATDPFRAVAATNLGVILAGRGKIGRALLLWKRAFDNNPQSSEVGLNLGMGLCAVGDPKGAVQTLHRVLRHNPGYGAARRLLVQLQDGAHHCGT